MDIFDSIQAVLFIERQHVYRLFNFKRALYILLRAFIINDYYYT